MPDFPLSRRGLFLSQQVLRDDLELFQHASENAYDPFERQSGAIALCIAENIPAWKSVREQLVQISRESLPPLWVGQYSSTQGSEVLRESLAVFAERHILSSVSENIGLNPANFMVAAGATAIIELFSQLLGDAGDYVGIPAPAYPVYTADIGLKAGLKRLDIHSHQEAELPGLQPLRIEDLDAAYQDLGVEAKRWKMLILTQPDNPTGLIYSASQLESFADWCEQRQIHLCVNEIYALSQFPSIQGAPFYSALRLIEARRSPYLHWWYSLSKDFGISGLRCGVAYSRNESVTAAFRQIAAPHTLSNHTQWLLSSLLSNEDWVGAFAKTNQRELEESYKALSRFCEDYQIPFSPARGSLFLWGRFNLDRLGLDDQTFWRKLYEDCGILITAPGGFGMKEKGWFRVVFSAVDPATLQVALQRMRQWYDGFSA